MEGKNPPHVVDRYFSFEGVPGVFAHGRLHILNVIFRLTAVCEVAMSNKRNHELKAGSAGFFLPPPQVVKTMTLSTRRWPFLKKKPFFQNLQSVLIESHLH